MTTAEQNAVQFFKDHTAYHRTEHIDCECGWRSLHCLKGDPRTAHAAHVVAALTNAGRMIAEQENVEWAIVGVDGQDEWIDTGEHEGHLSSQEKAQQRVDDYYRGDETAIVVRRFVTEWQPVAAARVAEGGERGE